MSGSIGSSRRSKAKKFGKKKARQRYTEKAKNIAKSKKLDASDIESWGDTRLKADSKAKKLVKLREEKAKKKEGKK